MPPVHIIGGSELAAGLHPTYRRYTGQESDAQRQAIAAATPDILLTNFMMLELLTTRQDDLDRAVIANAAGLDFLVLDELHTYRGRQDADVAMLVRRVKDRLVTRGNRSNDRGRTIPCAGFVLWRKALIG